MKEKKQSDVAVLLKYAGSYKRLTFLGLGLSAAAMFLGMAPYICIWLAVRDLIAAAPDFSRATHIAGYGWMAFAFAVGGIVNHYDAGRHARGKEKGHFDLCGSTIVLLFEKDRVRLNASLREAVSAGREVKVETGEWIGFAR